MRLRGPLDAAALTLTLNEIVRRHEALRTTFALAGDAPLQIIAPVLALALPVTDLSTLAQDAREQEAQRLASVEALLSGDALIDQLKDGGRLAGAIIEEGGITRLFVGRKAGGGFGFHSIADSTTPALPGFGELPFSYL